MCVYSLHLAHSGGSCRSYFHSDAILSVPQLWSKRNWKHLRTAEVTEGAKLELLLFSHKWKHQYLSELVTSQSQDRNRYRQRHNE